MFAEEDDIDFKGPFTAEAMDFVLPGRGWAGLVFGLCAAAFLGLSVHFLSPVSTWMALGGTETDGAVAAYCETCPEIIYLMSWEGLSISFPCHPLHSALKA